MTKEAALHNFFNNFGLEGVPTSSVPGDIVFPYLTYELITDNWLGGEQALTVNLWYYTESEAAPNKKAREISEAIGAGGKILACDGGYIWIKRGSPWCQNIVDTDKPQIKRRYINITAEYLTLN